MATVYLTRHEVGLKCLRVGCNNPAAHGSAYCGFACAQCAQIHTRGVKPMMTPTHPPVRSSRHG